MPKPPHTSQLILKQMARPLVSPLASAWVIGTTTSEAVALMPKDTTTITNENSPNSCAVSSRRNSSEARKCAADTARGPAAETA